MVTFRCTGKLKMQIESFASTHRLRVSEMIRRALVKFMQQAGPDELGDNVADGSNEATLAIISRAEPPIKRDAAIHHHIAFLNRDDHDYHGFRVTITRHKHTFRRYFSPDEHGSEAAALAAAMAARDEVLAQLELNSNYIETICKQA